MTRTAISVRSTFTRLQSFANVQAREFARHPDCSYRSESLFRLPSKSLRVRWLFHRFRSGPQSDSLTPSQDSGNPLGSRGFYFRAYLSSLPPRAADILTVRFGQLTVEGLSPSKIRSLVGCSHDFKRIMDTSAEGDMDMLCSKYSHFFRFAKLMEQLAEGIAAGKFDDVLGKKR